MKKGGGNDELCVRNIIVIMCPGTNRVSPNPLPSTFHCRQNVFFVNGMEKTLVE